MNKKHFLKDTVSILKQLLDEKRPEYFFDCYKITKDVVFADYKSVQNYVIKNQKKNINYDYIS